MPLRLHERRHRRDDEEVIGVGEETHSRDENGTAVEPARGCLVQELAHGLAWGGQACLWNRIVPWSGPADSVVGEPFTSKSVTTVHPSPLGTSIS